MLRVSTSSLLKRLTIGEAKCGSNEHSLEFVRWRRKPRWLPVAKSKLFRVPERKPIDPDERAELMRLHNNYHTQMRSLRRFLRDEMLRKEEISTAAHIVMTPEEEEAEFQRCLVKNEEWNKEIAAERAARLEKERTERMADIKERLEAARLREEERLERIEATVRREKELAKTFITRERLDEAIEQALANPVDHNFAIDLKGQIYKGRHTTTSTQTPEDQLEASN